MPYQGVDSVVVRAETPPQIDAEYQQHNFRGFAGKKGFGQSWHQKADYRHPTYRERQGRRPDHRSDVAAMLAVDNRFLNQYAQPEDAGSVLISRGLLAILTVG